MREHEFTLVIEGGLTQERLEALFEGGCADMTFQGERGLVSADVHREATSLVEAALSAVADIERVPGLQVVQVEGQDLVGLADIAWRLDRSPESVRLLARGRRGPGGFPRPAVRRRRGQLWRWVDVAEWANQHLGASFDPTASAAIAAINAALALRRESQRLSEAERRGLRELAAAS